MWPEVPSGPTQNLQLEGHSPGRPVKVSLTNPPDGTGAGLLKQKGGEGEEVGYENEQTLERAEVETYIVEGE